MRSPGPMPRPGETYNAGWATRMVRMLDSFFLSIGGDWVCRSLLATRAGRRKAVTLVTAASYTILLTDHIVDVNRAGAVALTLPENPGVGQEFYVQDSSGAASSNTITVNESASIQVNGTTSVTLTTNYGRLTIIYNGTMYVSAAG